MSTASQAFHRSSRSPNTEALFDALADRRRQRVITCLADAAGPLALPDLARRVARLEADERTGGPSETAVRRVRTSLVHKHVPKLVDVDLAERDDGADALVATDRTTDALHLLDAAHRLTV